jgi:hypothetical protein
MTRLAAWLDVRLDRIARRWARIAEAVSAPWYRSLDRIAGRWARIAEAVSAPWYRSLDRIAGRWDRIAEALSIGWERSLDRIAGRWDRIAEAASVGWQRLISPVHPRRRHHGKIGRDRLTNRHRDRRVRTARLGGERHRRRVADGIVVAAIVGIVGVASLATLSTLRDAGGERSAANDDLSAPGDSSDRAGEGPGGTGTAPEERPLGSDGSEEQLGAFSVYRDERTGYRFSYPSGWEVSDSQGITRLADAAGEVIISFRTAPSGSIEDFSERLMGTLASRYARLDLVAREAGESPQGEPSLVLGGKVTDTDGSSMNFMIVVIEGPGRNRGITVRFSGDAGLLSVSSSIQRIAGSFTTSALPTAT